MGCLRNWVGMLVRMGLRNVVTVGPVKSRLSVHFLNVSNAIPKEKFFTLLKQVLPPDAFEDFMHHSILDKTIFWLGKKQGVIVNNDCSSWYNRVGDF